MIKVDDDYSWYEVLPQQEDEIGTHQGSFRALNVPNPQPGWRYYWAHYHARDNYSELVRFIDHDGWVPVLEGEPEYATSRTAQYLTSRQNADRLKIFGDVVLLKKREEEYAKDQQAQNELATQQLYGLADKHAARGEEMARRFRGNAPRGRPLYYAREDHHLELEEFDPQRAGSSKE